MTGRELLWPEEAAVEAELAVSHAVAVETELAVSRAPVAEAELTGSCRAVAEAEVPVSRAPRRSPRSSSPTRPLLEGRGREVLPSGEAARACLGVTTPPEIILYYRLNHFIWSLSDNKESSR
jgi:hypothetical protein